MPYEEIALAVMAAPVSSVKTWIHRARTRLRELLKGSTMTQPEPLQLARSRRGFTL